MRKSNTWWLICPKFKIINNVHSLFLSSINFVNTVFCGNKSFFLWIWHYLSLKMIVQQIQYTIFLNGKMSFDENDKNISNLIEHIFFIVYFSALKISTMKASKYEEKEIGADHMVSHKMLRKYSRLSLHILCNY